MVKHFVCFLADTMSAITPVGAPGAFWIPEHTSRPHTVGAQDAFWIPEHMLRPHTVGAQDAFWIPEHTARPQIKWW